MKLALICAILKSMGKTILFAGKDIPAGSDMASGAAFHGRKVIVTCEMSSKDDKPTLNDATVIPWNRGSVLSSRSLVLNCENDGGVDEAVLVFDEAFYASKFGSINENSRILEEVIGSYQYLAQEIVLRFQRNENKSKIVFLYKSNPTLCDSITLNAVKIAGSSLSYPLIAAAGGAFKAFAENMAATLAESKTITPLLVSCEYSNDLATRDSALSVWLCDYMDSVDNLKKPLSMKQKVSWIKAGAKNPGGFGLF